VNGAGGEGFNMKDADFTNMLAILLGFIISIIVYFIFPVNVMQSIEMKLFNIMFYVIFISIIFPFLMIAFRWIFGKKLRVKIKSMDMEGEFLPITSAVIASIVAVRIFDLFANQLIIAIPFSIISIPIIYFVSKEIFLANL